MFTDIHDVILLAAHMHTESWEGIDIMQPMRT